MTRYSLQLPQYLYFGTLLNLDSLLKNVPDSVSRCIFTLEQRFTFSAPIINNACIFEPSFKFDIDLRDECSEVTIALDSLIIENNLIYCADHFLFIESVWPSILIDG